MKDLGVSTIDALHDEFNKMNEENKKGLKEENDYTPAEWLSDYIEGVNTQQYNELISLQKQYFNKSDEYFGLVHDKVKTDVENGQIQKEAGAKILATLDHSLTYGDSESKVYDDIESKLYSYWLNNL
jgi:hypothetical protein